jgi:hypothetical protein
VIFNAISPPPANQDPDGLELQGPCQPEVAGFCEAAGLREVALRETAQVVSAAGRVE